MDDLIDFEAMAETFDAVSIMEGGAPLFITDLDSLRKMWGDDIVNQKLVDGTIATLDDGDGGTEYV